MLIGYTKLGTLKRGGQNVRGAGGMSKEASDLGLAFRSARDERARAGYALEGMSGAAQIHCELSSYANCAIRHFFDPGSN